MGRSSFERISQREYARRLGVSNEAVSRAVKEGKIVKGWDKKANKIIFEKANEEWGNIHISANQEGSEATAEAIKRLQTLAPTKTEQPRIPKQQAPDVEDTEADALQELEQFNLRVATNAPFAEALRAEKVAKARQEIIKTQKLIGTLVPKGEVYKQLFNYHQAVKAGVLAVPDRCIDEILSAPNRPEAFQVLTKHLHEALEKLSDADKIEFESDAND